MGEQNDVCVYHGSICDPMAINLLVEPVSDIEELTRITKTANTWMRTTDPIPFNLAYRGQDAQMSLVSSQIAGASQHLHEKLSRMLAVCRNAVGPDFTDQQVYFMMRHAGLPSHLLDWSWQWEVALWFAIHDEQGRLKKEESSLWALRPLSRDLTGGVFCGQAICPVFWPADQRTCESSWRQDGCAYRLRFVKGESVLEPVPMDHDPYYRERLLQIPLTAEMSSDEVEEQLLRLKPGLPSMLSDSGPIPKEVVAKCFEIFSQNERSKS